MPESGTAVCHGRRHRGHRGLWMGLLSPGHLCRELMSDPAARELHWVVLR
jgi:hypothetical protein